ncbi:MAG TPA: GNAT family protein [Polyangia bacterium]
MHDELTVRALTPDDAQAFVALRTEALVRHPLAFSAVIEHDFARSIETARVALVEDRDSAIFGLFSRERLVGMVGVERARKVKRRHQASVWGLYDSGETPDCRGERRLLEAVIAWARAIPAIEQLRFSAAESAGELRKLCASLGFREWGLEPRALQWDGQFVAQAHMVLELKSSGLPR